MHYWKERVEPFEENLDFNYYSCLAWVKKLIYTTVTMAIWEKVKVKKFQIPGPEYLGTQPEFQTTKRKLLFC